MTGPSLAGLTADSQLNQNRQKKSETSEHVESHVETFVKHGKCCHYVAVGKSYIMILYL